MTVRSSGCTVQVVVVVVVFSMVPRGGPGGASSWAMALVPAITAAVAIPAIIRRFIAYTPVKSAPFDRQGNERRRAGVPQMKINSEIQPLTMIADEAAALPESRHVWWAYVAALRARRQPSESESTNAAGLGRNSRN